MTRSEYLAMRARLRGESAQAPATCAACNSADLLCSCLELYALGIVPPPARNGATGLAPAGGHTEFANLHDANDTTAHFFGDNPLANSVRHDVCQNGAAA